MIVSWIMYERRYLMKKFGDVYQLTRDYLNGKLEKFSIDFKNENCCVVSVVYQDDFKYRYDYDVEINREQHDTHFLGHSGTSVLCKLNLERNQEFEKAICNYLCNGVK